ncbi:MAG: septum formation initiator family protein [Prevotella sp.]|nr:septum formation initiator family protein [Prevotella sp.]
MSKITGHIFRFLSRFKFHIVIILGILIVGVLDENSFMRRIEYAYQIDDLKAEIQKYNRQYQHDTQQLKDLRHDPKAIARIARERYFMKADDEDIFVLSDDEQPADNTPKYETAE